MFYDQIMESAAYIRGRIAQEPSIGVVLGSGLGALVDVMEDKEVIPYTEIPHFPQSHVEGHAGNLVLGSIGSRRIIAMQGRFHYYEGFTMKEVTYPLYVMKQLGVQSVIITNACGAINKDFKPGDLMLITDYINFSANNSLIGINDERLGPRFPDMTEAFNKELLSKAEKTAASLGIECRHGVYNIYPGPCFESAAEIRAFAVMGADAVGMSTVPEVIAANYLGMKVLGISCITNMATGIAAKKHDHHEVLRIANEASDKLCRLVEKLIAEELQ